MANSAPDDVVARARTSIVDIVVLVAAFALSAIALDDFPSAPGNAAVMTFPITYALLRR